MIIKEEMLKLKEVLNRFFERGMPFISLFFPLLIYDIIIMISEVIIKVSPI